VTSVSILVALEAGTDVAEVEPALEIEGVEVVGFVHGIEDDSDPLLETPADVLVLACAEPSNETLGFIRSASVKRPNRPVVVLTCAAENGYVSGVFDAGADDLVRIPGADWWRAHELADDLPFVLEKVLVRRSGAAAEAEVGTGRLICVLGPKGGIGKTLTASNLAVSLAATGATVTVVDVDLQFGDIGLALGLRPDRTLYELARSAGALDVEKLDAFLAVHASGARALLAPRRPDEAGAVTPELLGNVYPLLRSMSDYVVVDTAPGFTPEVIRSIDSSSDVCIVGMLDSLSLKNTKLGIETLDLMGYAEEHVRVVLNRADSRVGITTADAEEILGRRPDVLVPSAREITRSVNEGVPISLSHPRSDAARAFQSLAALYGAAPANGSRRQRRRRSKRP
jgi:pilus assembly protein CpaE